ncbi:MAG: hypothetical protein GC190_21435 [Alphaproteobacteria bacterium]|nr:hypothetical protein [Alphaproteobacteria bacterium]
MVRVLIAGVLGGIAMFVWTSIAHIATPLGSIGFTQIPNEETVLPTLQNAMGDKQGLYFFPWVDPNDPNAMAAHEEKTKTVPSGIMIYNPPGSVAGMNPGMLIGEFSKELAQTLIAAFLLSLTAIGGYVMRVVFVSLIGVSASLSTNVSYLIWYNFPPDYTLGNMSIEVVGGIVAGLVIAAIVRPRAA